MKRLLFIMFCAMFSLAGMAQNLRTVKGAVMNENDEPLSGVIIKAVNSDSETITDKNGRFELKVDLYIKFVEASYENYITAKAEIDGSYIVFNLKVDKQLLKEKAKAEAEAKKAAAEQAKAEAEAKRAAEQAAAEQAEAEAKKAAAEKAKAEAEAKAKAEAEAKKVAAEKAKAEAEAKKVAAEKAKAEADARRAAEKAAVEKTKAEAEAKRAVAEKNNVEVETKRIACFSTHISGYNSVIDVSSFSFRNVGVNYIGGYRFNNYLFVGAGAGVEMPLEGKYILEPSYVEGEYFISGIKRGVTIPLFAHARANFLNCRWSPFFALSAGARFMIPKTLRLEQVELLQECKYNFISPFVNPQLGVNFRATPKTSVYLSVGVNGYVEEELNYINRYEIRCKPRYLLGYDLHFGVTF